MWDVFRFVSGVFFWLVGESTDWVNITYFPFLDIYFQYFSCYSFLLCFLWGKWMDEFLLHIQFQLNVFLFLFKYGCDDYQYYYYSDWQQVFHFLNVIRRAFIILFLLVWWSVDKKKEQKRENISAFCSCVWSIQ